MIRFAFLFAGLSAASCATTKAGNSCDIDARLDITGKNPPVILVGDGNGQYSLAEPTRRTTTSSFLSLGNKKILLACPGKGNSLSVGGKVTAEATCVSKGEINYFVVNGKQVKTDSITCRHRVEPYEFNTNESCNTDGIILKLGYMVNEEIKPMITTCHRVADGMTYYSTHSIDGSSLPLEGTGGKRKDDSGRPFFNIHNRALFKGFSPSRYYNQKTQLTALITIMGKSEAEAIYDAKTNRYFARGHLAPNADFVMDTSRDITFSFVNAQPQWQMINGGHWSHLETTVRKSAAASGRKYFIATGTNGILNHNGQNIYLEVAHRRIPAPATYTKVVQDVETNKCIAFISNNFPADSAPKEVCENICSDNNWPTYTSSKDGYIYCCSYEDFKTHFPQNSPAMNCGGGVLSY